MSVRLVPKSMTLNDFERRNDRYIGYFAEFDKPAFHCMFSTVNMVLGL